MGLRNTWARMPAQLSEEELAQLAPELEQLTLLRESALPQKRRTLESSRGNVNETKLSNITRELGKAILPDVDFNAAKERGEGLPSIGRQAQGVDDLEASLESLRREPQAPQRTDWTPLLRFSERLGAKTPATKYNPPQEPPTPLERKQIELKLQDLIQRRKESEAMNFLKAISAQKIPQPVLGTTGVITDATQKADEKKSAMVQTPMGKGGGVAKPKLGNILKEDQYRKAEATANLLDQLDQYTEAFKKFGYSVKGSERALLEQKRSSLMSTMGVADAMGALQAHEIAMLKKRLGGTTGVSGPLQGMLFRGGKAGDLAALRDLQGTFAEKGKTYMNSLKKDPVYGQGAYAPQIGDLESRISSYENARGRDRPKKAGAPIPTDADLDKMTDLQLKQYFKGDAGAVRK